MFNLILVTKPSKNQIAEGQEGLFLLRASGTDARSKALIVL